MLERLEKIMKDFNKSAGYGVFPMGANDFYFVLEALHELLKERAENEKNNACEEDDCNPAEHDGNAKKAKK